MFSFPRMDFWSSSHHSWLAKDYSVLNEVGSDLPTLPKDEVVYVINAIDSLADQLPRFVRNVHLHYSAMVLAHRYMQSLLVTGALDGELCCEIAAAALHLAIEADGRSIPSATWDAAIKKIFPCQVVHRGTASAIAGTQGEFLQVLNFDLHVHQPFETVSLLLAELGATPATAGVAFGILNSLFRTTSIVEFPPQVTGAAAVVGALLLTGEPAESVDKLLCRLPIDEAAIRDILQLHLFPCVRARELPLPTPPAVNDQPSPSARTGRSVSRQSSRIPSTRSQRSTVKRKREDPLSSLAWALLPAVDENCQTSNRGGQGQRRPVGLSELRILREISAQAPSGLVRLTDVRLYTPAEEHMQKSSGVFTVSGQFDSSGSQFDSIVRLLGSEEQLMDVIEQLLSATLYLNEHKICHFGIEPKNLMITANAVKIASLSTATVLPTIPTTLPSLPYRAPELLLGSSGGAKDDPLAVDLWSLGCVIAEIARIFATRNRYEDPLFRLTDALPDKPTNKFPVSDTNVYTNCRYLMRITECLNKGIVPARDVWPDMHKRGHYEGLLKLMEYKNTHFPDKKLSGPTEDLRTYMRDKDDGVATEIVKALLRWCPERRVSPRVCLARIIKHKLN